VNLNTIQTTTANSVDTVEALTFDLFGTVVDWRGGLIRATSKLGRQWGINADWEKLAESWRKGLAPAIDKIRSGRTRYVNLDHLNRIILDDMLPAFGLGGLDEERREELNRGWQHLDPWPEVVDALKGLRRRYIVAPLTNGTVATVTRMARHGGLQWDCILSSEFAKCYKWNREVYVMAAQLLRLRPDQILMVAAHQGDLRAARKTGMKTAFVRRPLEYGPAGNPELDTDPKDFDLIVDDFNDLASKLGIDVQADTASRNQET
jgi:2-haloacid dehalogenase